MSEPLVIAAYVATYGAILGYAAWIHFRQRAVNPEQD